MSWSERRNHSRFLSQTGASILLSGKWSAGVLMDFSLSGALFDLTSAHDGANGKACLLRVSECNKLFNGLVVHSKNGLLGIKFIGVGQAEQDVLMRIIDNSQWNNSILDRDIGALLRA